MEALERQIRSGGYRRAMLETGVKQVEAIHLYQHMGYGTTAELRPLCWQPEQRVHGKDLVLKQWN